MNRFTYSIVQITPRLSAGECVNFAVIVGSDQLGDWAVRQVQDPKRARRFCGVHAMTAASEFMIDIEERIFQVGDSNLSDWLSESHEPELTITEQLIDDLSNRRRGVVRLSQPQPVLADTADEALDLLTPEFLMEPTPRVFRRLTKQRVVADVRWSYLIAGLDENVLQQRPALRVGRDKQFHFRSDLAVVTDEVMQLCSAWSFQIVDVEDVSRSIQAWGWNVRELRDYGGVLEDGRTLVPKDVDLQVIVAPDPSPEGQQALADAESVFAEVHASVVPYAERQRIAESALRLVG
jgi:hypothetical protein